VSIGGNFERMLMPQMEWTHHAAMDCFDRAALSGRARMMVGLRDDEDVSSD